MKIPIESLINYVECPNRSTLIENKKLFDTRESIIAYIGRNLFLFIVEKLKKSKLPKPEQIDKELNILWSKIRKNISFNVSSNDYVIIKSLCNRILNYLVSLQKIEVIFSDENFLYQVGDHQIEIPITCIRSSNHLYIYYLDSNVYGEDIPSSYSILGALLEEVSKTITAEFKYAVHINIYKFQSLRLYKTSKNKHVDIVLNNILKGIGEIVYPKVSINTCKYCKFKETCKWYEKD